MKLLFMGDLQFGRKGKICDLELPNNILKKAKNNCIVVFHKLNLHIVGKSFFSLLITK